MKMWVAVAVCVSGAVTIIIGVAMLSLPVAVILAGGAVLAAGAMLIDVAE